MMRILLIWADRLLPIPRILAASSLSPLAIRLCKASDDISRALQSILVALARIGPPVAGYSAWDEFETHFPSNVELLSTRQPSTKFLVPIRLQSCLENPTFRRLFLFFTPL